MPQPGARRHREPRIWVELLAGLAILGHFSGITGMGQMRPGAWPGSLRKGTVVNAQWLRTACLALLLVVTPAVAGVATLFHHGDNSESTEVARVRAHIARAEHAIAWSSAAGWSAAQADARRGNLARLEAYRREGRFPHNEEFRGRRVPYFRDRRGVLCAMAQLIDWSGRRDLVDAVARRRNNATVMELAADPELGPALVAWLAQAGLTVAEAQAVQPAYGYSAPTDKEISHFRRNSALLGAVSLGSLVLNAQLVGPKPSPGWAGALGFAGGGFQIVLGAQKLSKDSVVGSLDLFVGAASMLTSISALARGGGDPRASMRTPDEGARLAPLLGVGPQCEPQAGLALSF